MQEMAHRLHKWRRLLCAAPAAPAPDADGLITLLRWLDRKGGLGYEAHEAIARAADLIAAQAAQIASLTAELADWKSLALRLVKNHMTPEPNNSEQALAGFRKYLKEGRE